MSDMQELFFRLYHARNEQEVAEIVATDPLLSSHENWVPYGKDRGNFGTFENQQPQPIAALVEKLTNSIDSIILRECHLKGIQPKSEDAPQSMQEALRAFFGIERGIIEDKELRSKLAEQIQIIGTGDKERPNLTIFDSGEGQHPDNFPDTFLSLHKNNKVDIHFVQGKYNMGSTGAVVFCGDLRYQLIGSKRNSTLAETEGKDQNGFGFTLVRRHSFGSRSEEDRHTNSWYEYFVVNEKIPRFACDQLDLNLLKGKFRTGSVVKLFSYQLPRGTRSAISWTLWQELNQYLYKAALPMLIGDQRSDATRNHIQLHGNYTRIYNDEKDKVRKQVAVKLEDPDFGEVEVTVTVFKDKESGKSFIRNKPVVFTLNGQANGFLTVSYISQELGFKMLAKCSLIHVNCTGVRVSYRQDIFMGNRYNLKEGDKYIRLKGKLTEALKGSDELRQLNHEMVQHLTGGQELSTRGFEELFNSIPYDPQLIKLLQNHGNLNAFENLRSGSGRKPVSQPGKKEGEKGKSHKSSRFPAMFRLESSDLEAGKAKALPVNGKGVISFETDVEDEYFLRPYDPGEMKLEILDYRRSGTQTPSTKGPPRAVSDFFNVKKEGPNAGIIKVTLQPNGPLQVGDEIDLCARLSAPGGNLEAIFHVRLTEPYPEDIKKAPKGEPERPALPSLLQVRENPEDGAPGWSDYRWNGGDVVAVITEDEKIEAIAVNMDCFVLQRYISKNRAKSEEAIKFARNKFVFQVYFHTLFLFGLMEAERKRSEQDSDVEIRFEATELVPQLLKNYSEFLLYHDTSKELFASLED